MLFQKWQDRFVGWRNNLVADPKFQRWAAGFFLTRPIAHKSADSLFGLVAGFVYSQVLVACVQLKLLDFLADGPRDTETLAVLMDLPHASAVRLLKGDLFRADVQMPDRTPPGLYTAKVMVFRNGRPFQSTLSTLVVSKVGAERAIFEFARDHAALHGLVGVAMALLAGFTASSLFRRFAPG